MLALFGCRSDAEVLFEHLISLATDVGLLSEKYDPQARRLVGNFSEALTRVALLNSARLLSMQPHQLRSAIAHDMRPAAS